MHLELIKNTDSEQSVAYKIARVVFAETGADSLYGVMALTSMINNLHNKSGREYTDIISDKNIFSALDSSSPQNVLMNVDAKSRAFQMCVRVATRMLRGVLNDTCNGATMFHHSDVMPDWATSRGYIADIDNMLFYL